jgi:tetratricopeptide (TPR) repeat protein
MASSDRIDELKRKFDENPRRYFAPLANEFRKSGDLDQAILICHEFLPQQPGHMSGHIVYGQALYENGRIDEARGVFETALSLDPENLVALRHLGDIAARQGDSTSARRWYERVLEADPRNDEIQSLLANVGNAAAAPAPPTAPAYSPPEADVEPEPPRFGSEPEPPVAAPSHAEDLLDLDVSVPDESVDRHTFAEPAGFELEPASAAFDAGSLGGFESTPETADLMPSAEGRAEGFEATEFSAPDAPVQQAEGLESAFEVETGVHVAFFQAVPGLEPPPAAEPPAHGQSDSESFPELDESMAEDRGEVIPPHGDPIAESAVAPVVREPDDSLLDFELPVADAPGHSTPDNLGEAVETASAREVTTQAAGPTIPTELPPEVIAAEAELIDERATAAPSASNEYGSDETDAESVDGGSLGGELDFLEVGEGADARAVAADVPESSDVEPGEPAVATDALAEQPPAEHRLFVTETMAELYLKQGLRPEALSVYEQLSTAAPGDERLAARVASLRAELADLAKASGPRVRDFFASFAVRRPGERAVASAPPADDDFGGNYTDEFPTPPSSIRAVPAPREHGAEPTRSVSAEANPERAGGSIDALFENRPIGAVEDSAASALAQAFGTEGDATPLAGNPTRPASGELTLDSVFREGARGGRTSQGFSFDQFFSQNVEGEETSGNASQEPPASGEPAERSEDDIEQFNSWLQGLKQR